MSSERQYDKHLASLLDNRHLSAREVANGVAPSAISRFINGRSDLGVHRLTKVLAETGTDPAEFFQTIATPVKTQSNLRHQIVHAVNTQDIGYLYALSKQELLLYQYGASRIHHLNSILIHAVALYLEKDGTLLSKSDSSTVAKYLLAVKKWYRYEFVLYRGTVLTLDTKLQYELFAKLIENSPLDDMQPIIQLDFIGALQNLALRLFFEKNTAWPSGCWSELTFQNSRVITCIRVIKFCFYAPLRIFLWTHHQNQKIKSNGCLL